MTSILIRQYIQQECHCTKVVALLNLAEFSEWLTNTMPHLPPETDEPIHFNLLYINPHISIDDNGDGDLQFGVYFRSSEDPIIYYLPEGDPSDELCDVRCHIVKPIERQKFIDYITHLKSGSQSN